MARARHAEPRSVVSPGDQVVPGEGRALSGAVALTATGLHVIRRCHPQGLRSCLRDAFDAPRKAQGLPASHLGKRPLTSTISRRHQIARRRREPRRGTTPAELVHVPKELAVRAQRCERLEQQREIAAAAKYRGGKRPIVPVLP